MGTDIKRTVLDNGMIVVVENIPHVRSCSIGLWINRGSRHEPIEKVGVSHFLEHMVFKGTRKRNAREIAMSIESVGGSLDAFTSREYTCFHSRVLDENIELAIDVLSDLIDSPLLQDEHIEREKQVIYEEIRNMEDTPDDLIHQLYSQTIWDNGPLGFPLLGTPESLTALSRDDVLGYLVSEYVAPNIIISAAGSLDPEEFIRLVEKKFEFLNHRAVSSNGKNGNETPKFSEPADFHFPRDCQQTHLCIGARSFPHADPRRYTLLILNNLVGGGMSSRLFQRVREVEALAYVVYSFQQFYRDAGLSGVYVGIEPSQRQHTIEVIRDEYANLLKTGIDEEELVSSKNQLKGQLVIGMESTNTRMFRLANIEIHGEKFLPVDEVISRLERVTVDEINGVAELILTPDNLYRVSLGPEQSE